MDKKDYEPVFKQAHAIKTPEFIVLHQSNTLKASRLGLAISKKVLPRAHQRNRIKRLLRESFRLHQLPAVDLVFLAKKGLFEKDNAALFKKLSLIWEKLITLYAD